nr:hypothetical protein [Kibdelosporangium sp. MJ126-NF4]CEL21008.1 hypothetical protein [Kibdelosporangium sp. MJ126-NF4]CTQ95478.1 hypothetical protein [Kibdelosporangium sp. MJ126-NF4]
MPKILLIVGMVLAIVVVCGLAGLRVIYVSTDAGVEPTSEQPAPECAVSSEALIAAKVSVYTDGHSYETSFLCKYATRKGSNGGTSTDAVVEVLPGKGDAAPSNRDTAFDDFARPPSVGQPRVEDDPRLRFGTQRKLYVTEYGKVTMLILYVRNGTTFFRVEYASSTKGFFSDSATPVDRMKPGLEAIAGDLDRRTRSGLATG